MKSVKAEKMVNQWNRQNPIRTHVVVNLDDGRKIRSVTREAAQVVSNLPVVWLEGIRGCYHLERVERLSEEEIEALRAAGEAVGQS